MVAGACPKLVGTSTILVMLSVLMVQVDANLVNAQMLIGFLESKVHAMMLCTQVVLSDKSLISLMEVMIAVLQLLTLLALAILLEELNGGLP